MNPIHESHGQNVENLSEHAIGRTEDALTSAQQSTGATLDSLKQNLNDLSATMPSKLGRIADEAETLARKGMERARSRARQVKDQAIHARESTVAYVKEEPVKSVLIAAAAGAILAGALGWLSRNHTTRH